jgi:integrase
MSPGLALDTTRGNCHDFIITAGQRHDYRHSEEPNVGWVAQTSWGTDGEQPRRHSGRLEVASAKRKILKDGTMRWYAKYIGSDGQYHEEGGYNTEREARAVAQRLAIEAERGEWVAPTSSKMTFKKFIDGSYWPAAQHLEVTTRAGYKSNIDKHFEPTFGHLPMRRIMPANIQAWINSVSDTLSPRSVGKYHALLHSVFELALEYRVVAYNPCAHSRLPKVITKAKKIITPAQFDRLLSAIPVRYQAMVLLDIETGLRWGELIALRPCDLDFGNREVHIHRTLVEVSKKNSPTGIRIFVKDYPKDDEPRIVQIEGATCQIIREHMLGYGVRDDTLLFTSSSDQLLSDALDDDVGGAWRR